MTSLFTTVDDRLQPLPSGQPLRGRHVAVVGGGLAGISAALDCADLGARVTLFERRRRLGGLTWSFDHNGMSVDNGQHVFLACCQAYLAFLDRIGSAGEVESARPMDVPVLAPARRPGGAPITGRLRRGDLPVPLHLAASLLRYPHISVAERLTLGRALLPLGRLDLDDPRLDQVTFGEWLSRHGQSDRTVAAVWDMITIATVNLPAAEASLAVAAKVFQTGLLQRRDGADIGWARVPLGRLHGQRSAEALGTAAVRVESEARIRAVRPVGSGAQGDGPWEVVTEDGTCGADCVVVALPHEEAAAVLPGGATPAQGRWESLGSSAIVNVHLVYDRQVTADPLFAGHRSPIQWVFDRTDSSGLAQIHPGRQYLAVSLSAADDLMGHRPEALVSDTAGALSQLIPALAAAELVDSAVTKERRATFRAAPGSAAVRPHAPTAFPGLALAGAWTATGWPATMEGAVRSGRSAAASLAATAASSPAPHGPSAVLAQIHQEVT